MSDRPLDPSPDDLGALAALHARVFAESWNEVALKQLLQTGSFVFVGGDGAKSGFIIARAMADEAEILTLVVAPEHRRRGIGRALVLSAATHAERLGARTLFLEVETANKAAIALYEALGFRSVGLRPGYYRSPPGQIADGLTMRAALPLTAIGKSRKPE